MTLAPPRRAANLLQFGQRPVRIGHQFLFRFALPCALAVGYAAVMLAATLFVARQAATGLSADNQARTVYEAQVHDWYAQIAEAQRPYPGTISDISTLPDRRHQVTVMFNEGPALRVQATTACLPTPDLAVGAAVTVLRVPAEAGVPPMFQARAACVESATSGAPASPVSFGVQPVAAASDFAPPVAPPLVAVRGHLLVEALAMFGVTLIALGLRRTLLMRRYGIGAPINRRRKLRRRNFLPVLGATVLLSAVIAYPLVDAAGPGVRAALAQIGF